MSTTAPTTPAQAASRIRQMYAKWYTAKYKGYPAVIHVGTVDNGTVEINAPAGEIWQKRIRVNIAELTDKQLVDA